MSTREILIRYDDVDWFPMGPEMEAALIAFMEHFCATMAEQDVENPGVWAWGRCYVGDLAAKGPAFEYGGPKDLPADGLGSFAVINPEQVQ